MKHIYPDYYKDFHCIGSACRHNCCIGWEIDIDSDTYLKYKEIGGEMGDRLKCGIAHGDEPHFKCRENGRCTFLNERNLCDIITELGEEYLSTICAEHPRFTNELPDRYEHGLGLCCEEAARIILTKEEPVSFTEADTDDEVLLLRDRVIGILQDRSADIDARCDAALRECGIALPRRSVTEWAEFYLTLERLDGCWGDVLAEIRDSADAPPVPTYMWENLLVYFVYRHMATAADTEDSAYRLAFAVLSYKMIASALAARDSITAQDLVELCRLYSAEIEYSTDNTDAVLDELYFSCEAL